MLRHSYKVEAMRLRTTMKSLELDLTKDPENDRAREAMGRTMKELNWFESMIAAGKDPGPKVL